LTTTTPASEKQRFVALCKEMADHTRSCCLEICKHLGACCAPEVCETVCQAARAWGLDLLPEKNGLLLDNQGLCTAPPHVRLLCTVHQCEIANVGTWKAHAPWTDRYYELRNEIDELAGRLRFGDLDVDPDGVLSEYKKP
jgi:hypothetical protein